ncbi:DUF2252 domain-containing protein [soil metagenome]
MDGNVATATLITPMPPLYPQPRDRAEHLLRSRHSKMARSAHAFVRGSTERFYDWLATEEAIAAPQGPSIWICGDCHTGNLGPVSNRSGAVRVGIRDLDQTVIGNPVHDLIRLGLSLTTAARGANVSGIVTAAMLEHMIDGYVQALSDRPPSDDDATPEGVDSVLRLAANRSWSALARERELDLRGKIEHSASLWPVSASERTALEALAGSDEVHQLVTNLGERDDDARVSYRDAAYWRKGCSSLGLLRYAVLVEVKQRHKAAQFALLDIKEATRALAPRDANAVMPRDNARRVVEGARHLTPGLGKRMVPMRLLGKSVFVRELRPQDLKLTFDIVSEREAIRVARYLATVVGHAHARQLGDVDRLQWRRDLSRGKSKTLDAPSWLWRTVIHLVMSHEAAYLDHCRRHGRLDELARKAA